MEAEKSRLARLRERFDRILAGRPPSDPLYLSNRTWKQKLGLGALITIPALILLALVAIGSTDMFRLNKADPFAHPVAEAPPPRPVPQPAPDPSLNTAGLEVLNLRLIKDAGPPAVSGMVRNNTDRRIGSVELSYYLADRQGSLVGSESTTIRNIEPHGSVPFRVPLKITGAAYAIVREVRPD